MDSSDGNLLHKIGKPSNDHLRWIETNKPLESVYPNDSFGPRFQLIRGWEKVGTVVLTQVEESHYPPPGRTGVRIGETIETLVNPSTGRTFVGLFINQGKHRFVGPGFA